jgi:Holliday junction resolvase-like predicted endonuclease
MWSAGTIAASEESVTRFVESKGARGLDYNAVRHVGELGCLR